MKKSTIKIEVTLDEKNVPTKIEWAADDSDVKGLQPVKSMFISLFDEKSEDTLKLDLWTKEFRVDEMDRFVFQTIRSMADSYFKATNNKELATHMVQFANFFGEQTEILKPDDSGAD